MRQFTITFLSLVFLLPILSRRAYAAEWTADVFKNPDLTRFNGIDGPTVIKQGPDLRFYVGSKGYVYALIVDDNYVVRDVCQSETIGLDRTVLGIAFEPRKFDQNDVYFYIATSLLNWGGGQFGNPEDWPAGWKNGMVQVMRSNQNGYCLSTTKNLVTGLSVSNHDHGVNGMIVGMDGKLYVLNGGMTNAGHSEKGDGDGGSPATPLSAALLQVDYNRADFNGDVEYDSDNGRIANIINAPHVEVYSAGLMNAFGIELHTNKLMYMTDNGPNPGYGRESTSCTENLPTDPHFPDKLLIAKEGVWYGHPNRNRGRSDPTQCVFRPIGANAPGQEPHIATLDSSTNGIGEYSANKLGNEWKGSLFFSRIGFGEPGHSYAFFLSEDGGQTSRREEIMNQGGLDLTMDRLGNIVMTEYMDSYIRVMRAEEEGETANAPIALWTVFPRRGPPKGDNKVFLTGRFGDRVGLSVIFGSRICRDVTVEMANVISCRVPRGNPGTTVSVTVGVGFYYSPTLRKGDYTYMDLSTNTDLLGHMV